MPMSGFGSLLVAGLVLLSVGLPLALSTPAAADGMAQFTFEPSTVEAQPGETFTVDLDLRSTPQFASGATQVGVVVVFNETYVNATGIERGPFMNLQEETSIETNLSEINNSAGYLLYELKREPAKGGTYGYATFATLTFEVAEDAPNGTFEIGVYRARILLADGMNQQVRKSTATVHVTGAGAATPAGTPTRGTDRTATANGSAAGTRPDGRAGTSTPGADAGSDPGSDGGTGFGVAGTVAALGGAAGLFGGMLVLMRKYVPVAPSGSAVAGERTTGPGSPGACPACGDEFADARAARDHAWDAHGACHHCGASYDAREGLYAHWLAAHEDQLSRLDRRKAEQAVGSLSTGDALVSLGLRGVVDGNRRVLLFGLVGVVVLALAFGVGYAVGGGSSADVVGSWGGGGSGAAGGASIGTPSGEVGPKGYNVTRQSTTQLGQPGSVHWHADFSVTIDGRRVDFSRSSYMLRSKYVHFEGGDGRRVHKHATGVTLTDLFYSIDWRLTDECLVTPDGTSYCSGGGGTLNIVVNGDEIDTPASYEIQDGDTVRVVFE